MKDFLKSRWDLVIILTVIIVIAYVNINIYIDCEGTVVRGMFTLVCIQ